MTVAKRILRVGADTQSSSPLPVALLKASAKQNHRLCPGSFFAASSHVGVPDLVSGVSNSRTSPWWSTVYLWAL